MQLLEVCRATKAQILKSIIEKKKEKKKSKCGLNKKDSVNAAQRTDKKPLWKLMLLKVNRIYLHMKIAGH